MRPKRLVTACLTLLTGAALVTGCSSGGQSSQSGHSSNTSNAILQMSGEGEVTIYTRNFNPFSPNADLGTLTAIYEPLGVYTPSNGKSPPWLASSWAWGPDSPSRTFTLRQGVEWSDGQPFTAADVAYTFSILKKYFAAGAFPCVQAATPVTRY